MTLQKYRSKRAFDETAEPKGVVKKGKGLPVFVVQKHDATRLHYDFRLEFEGVLLSWAVPKGPSMNPADKRLAIQVEDHPFDYRNFEGIIPEGNYGAGTVMLWDEGTYSVPDAGTKKEIEESIRKGIKKGHLRFILHGHKLEGAFDLIRLHSDDGKKNWLLVKGKDDEANTSDILKKDASVRSEKTLKEIAGGMTRKGRKKSKTKLPPFFKPMLATLIEAPFDNSEWLFETKWDGYRALSFVGDSVHLWSRNENSFNSIFPSIVEELSGMRHQVILDGECVILDKNGRSDFQSMQNYQTTREGDLYYYVFDLLFLDGEDLRDLALIERKERLKKVLEASQLERVRYSDHIIGKGIPFYKKAAEYHLEGIVGKRMDSTYRSARSRNWVKIKTHGRQEAVIGGFTAPKASRKKFGALLLGIYNDKKEFVYIGHVGTGFTEASLKEIHGILEPLIQEKSPFSGKIKSTSPVTWVKPKVICEVSFSELTREGIMRHPVFEGLRMDKKAKEVGLERPLKKEKKTMAHETVTLTNPDKIYWPKPKYTKKDMMDYYIQAAPYILPFLKDRPMMLRRYPDGIESEGFVQKDTKSLHLPEGVVTTRVEHEGKALDYFLVNNEKTLEYVVNLGTIELHPFHSRIGQLDYPDYFVLDLDPESVPFNTVMKTATTIHQFMEAECIPHYLKTSGGRGLHIYIPLHAKYTEEQIALFGQVLGLLLHAELPKITSLERKPINRQKKIYLDVLQNRSRQTVIAPFSLRAKPYAPVSTPLEWSELTPGVKPQDFNIKTVPLRFDSLWEIFSPVLGKGFNILSWIKQQKVQ